MTIYFFILLMLQLILLFIWFRRFPNNIITDSSFYFISLAILYVLIPSIYLSMDHIPLINMINHSENSIHYQLYYSLYFESILSIYLFIKVVNSTNRCITIFNLISIDIKFIFAIYLILTIYIIVVFLNFFPSYEILWGNRSLASELSTSFNTIYKFEFIYSIIYSITIYMAFKFKSIKFLFLLTPYILMDIYCTNRTILFQSLMCYISIIVLSERSIPFLKLIFFSFVIISLEFLRVLNLDNSLIDIISYPGEFINTYIASLVILESSNHFNFFEHVFFSLGRTFIPLLNRLYENPPLLSDFLNNEITLHFGFGGSLFSGIFIYKSFIIEIAYPLIIILGLEFINYCKNNLKYLGFFIFSFYLFNLQIFFRTGFIETFFQIFYYVLFSLFWVYFSFVLININKSNYYHK